MPVGIGNASHRAADLIFHDRTLSLYGPIVHMDPRNGKRS